MPAKTSAQRHNNPNSHPTRKSRSIAKVAKVGVLALLRLTKKADLEIWALFFSKVSTTLSMEKKNAPSEEETGFDVSICPDGDSTVGTSTVSSQSSSDNSIGKENNHIRPGLTRELLQAAVAINFKHRSDLLSGRQLENGGTANDDEDEDAGTAASSPSITSSPLRDRLRRLSRSQRKDLLLRSCPSQSRQREAAVGEKQPDPNHSQAFHDGVAAGVNDDDNDTGIVATDCASTSEESNIIVAPQSADSSICVADGISYGSIPAEGEITSFPSLSVTEHPMPSTNSSLPLDDRTVHTCTTTGKPNDIKLHIYDLIAQDTLMQLPWGCVWEIGKCFNEMNTALHELGTGVYHVGIEVNGSEYAYGATSNPGRSGVFSCIPRLSPGYQYRTTIDFGKRILVRKTWVLVQRETTSKQTSTSFRQKVDYVDGREIIRNMAHEYMGIDYDILRRNCCTFARDACLRLGIEEREIPSWFRNLAESGAMTQDLARATVLPLTKVLSSEAVASISASDSEDDLESEDGGFEIVARRHSSGRKDLLVVVAANPKNGQFNYSNTNGFRRTTTWAN